MLTDIGRVSINTLYLPNAEVTYLIILVIHHFLSLKMATSGNYINENGIQMENKSKEILHHLGNQKDAKLCLKCTKIRQ